MALLWPVKSLSGAKRERPNIEKLNPWRIVKAKPIFCAAIFVKCLSAVSLHATDSVSTNNLRDKVCLLHHVSEQYDKQKVAEAEFPNTNTPSTPSLRTSTESQSVTDRGTGWSPTQPIQLARSGGAYANISFDVMANVGWSTAQNDEIRTGHHAPYERGFSLRSAEVAIDGAVDPYFKGLATVALALDEDAETVIELEEAWAQTTSLPGNLQVKAGQFYAAFGRQNTQHAHEWAFVDQPLVLYRFFGPDGFRQPGAQISWLFPVPFYAEAMVGMFNNHNASFVSGIDTYSPLHGGEPVERKMHNLWDYVYVPRFCVSFDLTDTQTLLCGVSAAFGPNDSGPESTTQIYGLDLYWKWRPTQAEAGFPFVSFQTEALYRRYEASERDGPEGQLGAETLHDWGFYSQILWGFKRRWVGGLRIEFVTGDEAAFETAERQDRFRLSPNLTFYPTEYSKLRLQYNYDNRQHAGSDHSVCVQLEFMLGEHAAHKF